MPAGVAVPDAATPLAADGLDMRDSLDSVLMTPYLPGGARGPYDDR